MGSLRFTLLSKIGYNINMVRDFIIFILRISLVALVWISLWRYVQPRTQLMRILRAALLVLCLLGVLVVLRFTGGN